MNNMPVTDLIQPPTPELYRDTIYRSLWGVRTCVSVHSCARASLSGSKQPRSICSVSLNSSLHLLLVPFCFSMPINSSLYHNLISATTLVLTLKANNKLFWIVSKDIVHIAKY